MSFKNHANLPWVAVGSWVENPDPEKPDICNCDPASLGQEHLIDDSVDRNVWASENAEFIAFACNTHYHLIEALQNLVISLQGKAEGAAFDEAVNLLKKLRGL